MPIDYLPQYGYYLKFMYTKAPREPQHKMTAILPYMKLAGD